MIEQEDLISALADALEAVRAAAKPKDPIIVDGSRVQRIQEAIREELTSMKEES